jgi:uncharacterized protein YkwD
VAIARPARLAALAVLAVGLFLAGGSAALAARARSPHAGRCASARAHSHAGSVRRTHRPARARQRRCRRRRWARAHHRAGSRQHARAHRRASAHRRRSRLAGPDAICQDEELRPSEENLDRIRTATLCLVNRERAAHSERPLAPDGQLRQAAQGHTESMIAGDYFSHEGGGHTLLERLLACGYIYSSKVGYAIGENIAWGSGALGTPKAIVAAWMASPGHRANILDPRYRDTAVGVSPRLPTSRAHGQLGGIYTQDFGVIITA